MYEIDARDRLRRLYGPGGLSDQLGTMRLQGLGELSFDPALSRAMALQASSNLIQMFTAQRADAAITEGGTTAPAPDTTAQCDCLIAGVEASFDQVSPDTIVQLRAACQNDPAGFEAALRAQAASAGVPFNASCGPGGAVVPWYKRPSTWVIGGSVILGGVLLYGVTR